jgi:hypothetical protein
VYAAAGYADLHQIRPLAADKFEAVAYLLFNKLESCALFIGAIKMAYNKTLANDHILRPLIAQMCVTRKARLFKHPKFKPTLKNNAALSMEINYVFLHAGRAPVDFESDEI